MKKEDVERVEKMDDAFLEARQRGKISIAEQIIYHNYIMRKIEESDNKDNTIRKLYDQISDLNKTIRNLKSENKELKSIHQLEKSATI